MKSYTLSKTVTNMYRSKDANLIAECDDMLLREIGRECGPFDPIAVEVFDSEDNLIGYWADENQVPLI